MMMNSSNLFGCTGNDVIHSAITQLFQGLVEEGKQRSALGKEITAEIDKEFSENIPKFTSKREELFEKYQTEMVELKVFY